MKKVVLLSLAASLSAASFAQKSAKSHISVNPETMNFSTFHAASTFGRTTATGDIDTLIGLAANDTPTIYRAGGVDSGFVCGTDAYGDMGFAQRFDFNGADSSMQVLGTVALFAGTVQPASTKTVTFHAWSQGPQTATSSSTIFWSGFPNTSLASVSAPITGLNIGTGVTINMFSAPTAYLSSSFFVGYTINYTYAGLAGDTIALVSTLDGERNSAPYFVSGADTIINDQNATQYSDGTWHDNLFDNFQLYIDYYIFPIVKIGGPTSVAGVTRNKFTFFGNYPNPAVTSTNIKFSLAANADVTVSVTDMSGHAVKTIEEKGLSTSMHEITLPTSDMAAGDYIYVIKTAAGDGMASKLTVIK